VSTGWPSVCENRRTGRVFRWRRPARPFSRSWRPTKRKPGSAHGGYRAGCGRLVKERGGQWGQGEKGGEKNTALFPPLPSGPLPLCRGGQIERVEPRHGVLPPGQPAAGARPRANVDQLVLVMFRGSSRTPQAAPDRPLLCAADRAGLKAPFLCLKQVPDLARPPVRCNRSSGRYPASRQPRPLPHQRPDRPGSTGLRDLPPCFRATRLQRAVGPRASRRS